MGKWKSFHTYKYMYFSWISWDFILYIVKYTWDRHRGKNINACRII